MSRITLVMWPIFRSADTWFELSFMSRVQRVRMSYTLWVKGLFRDRLLYMSMWGCVTDTEWEKSGETAHREIETGVRWWKRQTLRTRRIRRLKEQDWISSWVLMMQMEMLMLLISPLTDTLSSSLRSWLCGADFSMHLVCASVLSVLNNFCLLLECF